MSKIAILGLFAILAQVILSPSIALSQPSNESLLAAWETIQKNDPKTVVFEKLGDKRYHFKTSLFPFDGELKITNIAVDAGLEAEYLQASDISAQGIVEVELAGLSPDFLREHAYSYSIWERNNILFYNAKTKQWLPTNKALQASRNIQPAPILRCSFLGLIPYVILIAFFIFLIMLLKGPRKQVQEMNARNRKFMEESAARTQKVLERAEENLALNREQLQLARENNETLKQILGELRKSRS